MTKQEAIKEAIQRIKGQAVPIGTIVATEDEPRTWQFDGYEYDASDNKVAKLSIGEERRKVDASNIFNVRKAINVGNHLLNLGFWNEGMESMLVEL